MEKIHAMMIIEILGKPVEKVKEAITTMVVRLGSEKGVKVLNKEIHEPVPVENSKSLFTTFAEIEVEFESIQRYLGIMFAYMPANVEIIRPEKITIQNTDLNDIGNILLQKLHGYDGIVKKVLVEKEMLVEKLKEVAPQLFKQQEAQDPLQPAEEPEKKPTKKKKKK